MLTVFSVIGTRPEAIKMAPVIKELAKYSGRVRSLVCVTGQHRQMLDQVLSVFNIQPDYDLNVMQANQTLPQLTSNPLRPLGCFTHNQYRYTEARGFLLNATGVR